jgi:hypothetical protein
LATLGKRSGNLEVVSRRIRLGKLIINTNNPMFGNDVGMGELKVCLFSVHEVRRHVPCRSPFVVKRRPAAGSAIPRLNRARTRSCPPRPRGRTRRCCPCSLLDLSGQISTQPGAGRSGRSFNLVDVCYALIPQHHQICTCNEPR